jgi:hypothetical protein
MTTLGGSAWPDLKVGIEMTSMDGDTAHWSMN